MARINLLPWRAEERERKNRDFVTLLALALILAFAAALATWYFFNLALDNQRQANKLITAENIKLDEKLTKISDLEIRREAIISRMKVIQDLQGRRPIPVHIWNDVAMAIPDALYLNNFQRLDDQLIFKGHAKNPNVVSSLVRNLDASLWMESSAVRNIQKNIAAYDKPAVGNDDLNKDGLQRTIYPEDDYVSFEVTTQIVATLPEDELLSDMGEASSTQPSTPSNNPAIDNNELNPSGNTPTNPVSTTDQLAENPISSNAEVLEANADSINRTGEATDLKNSNHNIDSESLGVSDAEKSNIDNIDNREHLKDKPSTEMIDSVDGDGVNIKNDGSSVDNQVVSSKEVS